MSILQVFIIFGVFAYGNCNENRNGIYTIAAPKYLRPNSPYKVCITWEEVMMTPSFPITFKLSMNCSNKIYKREVGPLEPGEGSLATILIGDIPKNNCNFTITRSVNQVTNQESIKIYVNRKESHILIQTDKPIYKPGETVNFRIILLNRQMRPIGSQVNITIMDSQKNIIQMNKNVTMTMGLYSSNITLSSEPNLGDWNIEASHLNQKLRKFFTVEQYVLPKFKVDVNLPPFVTYNSSHLIAEVKAIYTYGKPVSGNCTIRLSDYSGFRGYGGYGGYNNPVVVERTVVLMNGTAHIAYNIIKDLSLEINGDNAYTRSFEFLATVTEGVTGKQINGSSTIKMYKYPYKIEQINQPHNVKPGFPIIFHFKVSTQNDIPISDDRLDAVQIMHGYSYDAANGYFNSSLPSNGTVTLMVQAPSNELISPSQIYITYKDLTTSFYPPTASLSYSKTYMQISCMTIAPMFGEPITVIVRANKPFNAINYVVFSRNEILYFQKFQDLLGENEEKFVFSIPIEKRGYSSEATLIVYGLFPNNEEIIADSIKLNFASSPSDNFLNISLSEKQVEPGQNVTLMLTSKVNSTIALKAVDQSVLLLKGESDITQDVIRNEYKACVSLSVTAFGYSRSTVTVHRIFDEAGLVFFTNGYQETKKPGSSAGNGWRPYGYGWGSYHSGSQANKMSKPNSQKYQKGKPKNPSSEIRVRKDFPETWIWEEIQSTDSEMTNVTKILPDTLTSWVITGFSLNAESGIGVSDGPQVLVSFRPFFLTLNLPYSIVKGEVFPLQVLVHNYMGKNISEAEITLFNEGVFEFVEDKESGRDNVTKKVDLAQGEVGSVIFIIVPTKFGILKLNVKGVTHLAGDALSQPLIVKPPGHKIIRNQAILLDAKSDNQMQQLTAEFPESRVPEADTVKISVIGDILGASITNLDKLIQLPTGCGEQNMLKFVPDIVIVDYLQVVGKLNPEIKSQTIEFLKSGYQRQLTYMHKDGSFSAFGESDAAGSTWLTAFVLKSFAAAGKHITINDNIMSHAVDFLIRRQQSDGQFIEVGRVISSDIQGGVSGNGLALTSYVVMALIEMSFNPEMNPKVLNPIKMGLNYIAINYAYNKDTYALVLATYTLHLADHEMKDWLFRRLERKATTQGGLKFWEKVDKKNVVYGSNTPEGEDLMTLKYEMVKPVSVEMTAYALMTYLMRGNVTESLPIVKWLLQQRTPEGRFRSTQDTVVGLAALANFAVLTASPNLNLKVQGIYDGNTQDIVVNQDNAIVLQEFFIPGMSRVVDFTAHGNGTALAQLSWGQFHRQSKLYLRTPFQTKCGSTNSKLSKKTLERLDLSKLHSKLHCFDGVWSLEQIR